MDSPVRQYLKQKDYRRHKLFRKIKRRQAAERQQAIDAPIKEMKRRLKRYGDGKEDERLKPWKALKNIDYDVVPDTTFTSDKTGVGDIEYFSAEHPEGITYPNGYHKDHPLPGKDVILYNPNDNDEQDVRLDALHIMPKDATYDTLNTLYRNAARDGDIFYNAKARYNEDAQKYGTNNIDSFEQYFNNEADGLLRNLLIEGTPEYIKSKRYYPDKRQLKDWNSHLTPYVDAIQNYLESGERPANVLPEVVVKGKNLRKPKKYDGGKNVPMNRSIDGVNLWRDDQTGQYFYQEANGPRIDLTPFNTLGSDDPTTWSFLDAEGKEYNPRRLYTSSEISQTTDAQRVANEVRDILNTRTWRSDVADLLHNFGDALMWSTMAMNPEGEALMTKALEKAASLRKLAKPTFNKAALLLQLQSKRLGGDLKYGTPNLFEKYIYGRKINGLSVDPFDIVKLPYYDAINELWSKDVAIGLSADAKQSLLDETIARNVRAFEEQGVDPLAILEYRNRAAALMDDVRVGRYTNQDYVKAGKDDIGGFYDDKRNFLSVNTESGFPDGFVEKHEGRHLLDHKLDDDILMGTNAYRNNLGSDFDSDATAKAMRMAVLKQNDVLTKAYDMDFVNLPNTKYAGSLKGYPHMEREAVTTNADSRRILFDKKHANDWSLELKDKLIDKVPKEDIFDAVELANGYGRRYIQFLRDNGKLTEEKANLFREAMKYKGIIAVPMAVGAGYGLIGGSGDVTFNKGKDDWLHSLLKTYWGGELPEVKVTARDLRKPQTFAGRIAQAAGASPAVSRGADLVSTAVLLTPYGIIPAALDLGMDSNSLYHGDEGAEKDVALDLLSMIPGVSKLGLKKTPTRTLKQMWDEALQAYRELVKFLSGVGKAGDAIDDTYGSVNVMSTFNKGKDSGIHIKPENRGKFNALKKRTGKTTEQLTHSKNPLTRKRAIFAQNSKRWSKKK